MQKCNIYRLLLTFVSTVVYSLLPVYIGPLLDPEGFRRAAHSPRFKP
jgi:hypothetical protein